MGYYLSVASFRPVRWGAMISSFSFAPATFSPYFLNILFHDNQTTISESRLELLGMITQP